MFSRIAVVNRGEAAMRLIHAVREINALGGEPIEVVALYTDAERTAMFVREADSSYALGPASARPYLDLAVLERALRETGADAAWVGWGFVAEDPAFAELCERLGVTFIGPSPAAMRALGDKMSAKRLAASLGIPVVPWAGPLSDDLAEAARQAAGLGLPIVLKPSTGTGGRGVREAETAERLAAALAEAVRTPGHPPLVLERRLDGVRQVDVQVIADAWGGVWALPARDASVQRWLEDARGLLSRWLPEIVRENRSSVTVAVGCTGGRHRSVFVAERLAEHFRKDWQVLVRHRGLSKEVP